MYKSKILSTGRTFPERRMSNDDLAKLVDTNDEWITERTGIRARRIADPAKTERNSDMALVAAKQALDRAGLTPNDVEFILYATVSPDHIMPNTACVLQE